MLNSHPRSILTKCTSVIEEANKWADTKEILETISKNETDIQYENLRWLKNNAELVHGWKIKIETFIAKLDEEIMYLLNRRSYIRKAIATLNIASNINAECILRRTTKLDGDYHDEIENELNQEKYLISDINDQLEANSKNIDEFVGKLKVAKSNLEYLWSNKVENYNIECENISLNQLSANIMLKYGAARAINKDTTRKEWEEDIQISLYRAENLLLESCTIHTRIDDNTLRENQQKLHNQAQKIDVCLSRKASITKNYIEQLEAHFKMAMNKQNDLENIIEKTENTRKIIKKSQKLVQTRLNNRLLKPFSEHINDEAQNGLLVEDENIQRDDLTLQKKKMQLEESIKELISVKTDIERELQLKLDSLWIDGNQCPLIRNHYPSANKLSGYHQ